MQESLIYKLPGIIHNDLFRVCFWLDPNWRSEVDFRLQLLGVFLVETLALLEVGVGLVGELSRKVVILVH